VIGGARLSCCGLPTFAELREAFLRQIGHEASAIRMQLNRFFLSAGDGSWWLCS